MANAQTSEYIVLSGDESTFSVLQGGAIVRSWSIAPGSAQYQYPIAVMGTIRTMGANEGDLGAEYDLFGVDLGPRYVHPPGPTRSWDGTTDGQNNYAIDTGGRIYRFGLDWSNPELLFDAGSLGSLTYDPTNDSLWVTQFSTSTVVEYSLGGTALRSFDTGHTQNMALALDHADGTLWLHDRTTQGTYEQWTKSGVRLTRVAIPGMEGQNALAGEFQFPEPRVCPVDGELVEGTGEVNDVGAACGSDDSYWAAHGATLFFQVADPVVQFELTALAPEGVGSTISVDIEASKESDDGNLNLRALLFNFSAGSYEALPGIFPLTTSDAIQTFDLPGGSDPNDFIEPGTNEVKLLIQVIQVSGQPNTRAQLDGVLFKFQ